MNFKRHIEKHLTNWKESKNRKPLILRGARQVGKTTLIKEFSETYKKSILLNLEKPSELRFFQDYEDVKTITQALFLKFNISTKETANTLLFIDEIQESPKALKQTCSE